MKKIWTAVAKIVSTRSLLQKVCGTLLLLLVILGVAYSVYSRQLPDIAQVQAIGPVSSKIFDRNGVLLYEIHGEYKRTPVPLAEISPFLVRATVAIEDKGFYKHKGISPTSIVRAAVENYKAKDIRQGGSTITQQLAKLTLLTPERSYERKIKEALLALKIERQYTKDQILEMYLNLAPYGRNTYGIEAASLAYFAKHAKDLTAAESAYLAALPKAPSLFSPTGGHPEELERRKELILDLMQAQGLLEHHDYLAAKQEQVHFQTGKTGLAAPYFVKWVEQQLIQQYGREHLEQEGLEVYTTLDFSLQKLAEKAVAEGADRNARRYGAANAALVAMEPKTGYIVAMVGGKDYFAAAEPAGCRSGVNCRFDPNMNVALALRQPGSSFKPYTYVTAFSEQYKFSPASKILDKSQNFSRTNIPYRPANYNNREYGLITMRQALAGSLNVAAVRTLSIIGVQPVAQTAQALGITSPMASCGLSLTLGACEVRLVDHVAGFAALANLGERAPATPVVKITNKYGETLFEHQIKTEQVVDAQAAYQVIDVLTDNRARSFIFGSRSPLTLPDRPVAAKTGTSQDFKDGWTLGFTPQLAAGVWVGNNDGKLMRDKADGVFVAAPIWNQFMKEALANLPVENFVQPEGIQRVRISASSGKLATEYTPDAVYETFASYSVPKQRDPYRPPATVDLGDIGGAPDADIPGRQGLTTLPIPVP